MQVTAGAESVRPVETKMLTQPPSVGKPLDPREGDGFFLNVAEKLDNPFPDLKYFRENRPVFYSPPLSIWFVFRRAT
jgi:hypothetical protein